MTTESTASREWASRPADERFASIDSLLTAAKSDRDMSQERDVAIRNLRFSSNEDGDLGLSGKNGQFVSFTNFAFRQFLTRIGYPINGIVNDDGAVIPAKLAEQVLNHRIQAQPDDMMVKLLAKKDDDNLFKIRAVTSDKYARFHDANVLPFVKTLSLSGWKVPPARPAFDGQPGTRPATEDDIIQLSQHSGKGLQVQVGDPIAPAGLYRGDRDMFCLLANDRDAEDDGNGGKLMRVLIIQNSEVGYKSFSIFEALLQGICGNHILWGIQNISEVSYRHVGSAYDRIIASLMSLEERATSKRDLSRELDVIRWMRTNDLATDKNSMVESIYKMTTKEISQKDIKAAWDLAENHRDADGAPTTWYGIANGLTRQSQTRTNMDDRLQLDKAVASIYDTAATLV